MPSQVHLSADRRREEIVAAAVRAVRQHGLLETTSRHVALEGGMSTGLLHHYFDTYDDLLAAAFERVATEDLDRATVAVEAASTPTERLDTLIREFAPQLVEDEFRWWIDAWSSSARHAAVRATAARLNGQWQQLFESVLRDGVATGEFDCPDPAAAAWRLLALMDGLTIQVVAGTDGPGRAEAMRWASDAALTETGRPVGRRRQRK